AKDREDGQYECSNNHRANSHVPALSRRRVAGQAGINRRTARRVNDDEKRDEGREEKLGHSAGASTSSKIISSHAVPFHILTTSERDLSAELSALQNIVPSPE